MSTRLRHEITMSGPGKNALGAAMMNFLIDQLREAGGRPVLLTGSGDAFSAGLNLKEVASLDGAEMLDFLRLLERCMTALYLYPGPTVALVNGHAIAGGAVLTVCCDYRVVTANPKARIGLNEVALGVRFPPRIMAILKQRLPPQHLASLILGAGLVGPAEALRLGLVDAVADDPATAARACLDAWSAHPAEAYAASKGDLRGTEAGLCADEEEERFLQGALTAWTSTALKQKIAAILAR
ncbi:MAG: enoyl-CoA hydratase/isomerase family protein [Minicystis sp.]